MKRSAKAEITSTDRVEIKKVAKVIPIKMLDAADWNVHIKVKDDDAEIRGLAETMNTGLIHSVVVMAGKNGRYTIIDGHRRVQAAKILGWTEIGCEIAEVDESTAICMTVTANLQRVANNPIKEAEAYALMKTQGRTNDEIAKEVGRSSSYIARIMQLTELDKCWVTAAAKQPFVTECLMRIAAYDRSIQVEVFKNSSWELKNAADMDEHVSWRKVSSKFASARRELTGCPFSTKACANCPRNTATHGELFPDLSGDKNGTCTDINCFTKKWNEATADKVKKLTDSGVKVRQVQNKWNIPGYGETSSKTKENTEPYLVVDDNGHSSLFWAKPSKNTSAKTVKEIAAEKAEKAKRKLLKGAEKDLCEWLKKEADGIMDRAVLTGGKFDAAKMLAIKIFLNNYETVLIYPIFAFDFIRDKVPEETINKFWTSYKHSVIGKLYAGSDVCLKLFALDHDRLANVLPPEDFKALEEKCSKCGDFYEYDGSIFFEVIDESRYGSAFTGEDPADE